MNKEWIELSKTLNKVIDYRGKTPKKLGFEWSETGYRALSALNVKTNGLENLDSIKYASEELYKKWMKEEIQRGDILLTSEAPAGQVMVWDSDEKIVLSQRLFALRLNSEYDNYFIKYFLQSDIGQKEINKNTTGSTVFGISAKMFDLIKVPKIKKERQVLIGKILKSLDAKIKLNNRINRELEAMAKTLYDYWFVQFDFPNADGKPYKSSGGKMVYNAELKREIPEGWEVKKLGELVYQVTDSISPDEYPELPYLPIDKLPMKQLYYYEYESRSEANSSLIRFKENDILLGAMRVYFHRVCHAISDGISRSTIIVLRPFKENTKNFALFALNKNEAIEFATNNSTGTSIPYAKWNDSLENYLIGVPKTDYILILFNKIVNPILEKFKVQNKQTQQLTELRDWLLPMLMNGQVTVRQAHGNAVKEAEESLSMAAEPSVEYKKG
ncbi:MAG TPA: restriction endonuclease subunit S [Paludibacteraceae bacterium]|nr:restriction endonuclease subunit S [Paludibacteraceae bacterium]